MFFNDTVAYVHSKTKDIVERQLNKDLKNMSIYFKTNHLIANLSKGKTETMILVRLVHFQNVTESLLFTMMTE